MEGIKLTLTVILALISVQSKSLSYLSGQDKPRILLKSSYIQAGALGSVYSFAGETNLIPAYTIQHGYNLALSEKARVGVGIGLTTYEKNSFAPAFLLCQYYLTPRIYYMIQGGYSVAWQRKEHIFPDYTLNGGLYGGTGLGYNFRINDLFCYFVQFSYQYQLARLSSNHLANKNVNFNSLALTVGIKIQKR